MTRRQTSWLAMTLAAGVVCLAILENDRARRWVRRGVQGVGILIARLREQGVPSVRLWIRDHAMRGVQGMSPADTSRITPFLYVGGQHYRRGLSRMADLGITATLSLRSEADDAARGVALERHLWLPTVDDTPPTLEHLAEAVGFIREVADSGRAVYVHCASGVGRAPTVAAAYLVSTGLPPEQAWAVVRRHRPFVRPKANQVLQVEQFCDFQNDGSGR